MDDVAVSELQFPELCTPRFVLRQIVADDINTVFAGLSDPRVIANYGVSYDSLEATRMQMDWFDDLFAKGTGIWWGICAPTERDALLGACGFNDLIAEHRRAEIGYWLLPAHWGKGVAHECVSRILVHAFESLRLHRIGAEVDCVNGRSSRLLESLGFQCEGVRRDLEFKGGAFLDVAFYGRLATDPVPPSFAERE